jgi:hypothetical protein
MRGRGGQINFGSGQKRAMSPLVRPPVRILAMNVGSDINDIQVPSDPSVVRETRNV